MFRKKKLHLKMVLSLLLVSSLTACGGGGASGSLPSTANTLGAALPVGSGPSIHASAVATSASVGNVAIDTGGGAVGNWEADTDYSSPWSGISTTSSAINTSKVSSPAPQAVYQTQRYSAQLTYTIPNLTPKASYNVRLHFAETFFTTAKQRVFNVAINGATVLSNFDIFATAGGKDIAVIEPFVSSADATGKITILVSATTNNASIAGIEVSGTNSTPTPTVSSTPSSPTMVEAIDAGGGSAPGGWIADTDYATTGWGTTAAVTKTIDTSHVSDPAPQSVYQSQRWAPTITYAIPKLAVNGSYTVQLHLVESNFSSAGQRVFNVSINGTPVLSNLDIFSAAGGQNIAIVKSFQATADSTGTITINLAATVNNASIAGIEILSGTTGSTPQPTPTPAPTSSATPSATPTPNSGGIGTRYSSLNHNTPPGGSFPYFPLSPLHVPLPANPVFVSQSQSSAWDSAQSPSNFRDITVSENGSNSNDASDPTTYTSGDGTNYVLSCTKYSYSAYQCKNTTAGNLRGLTEMNGATVSFPAGFETAGDSDHHAENINTASGYEDNIWEGRATPSYSGATWAVGGAGRCSLLGDGTGCAGADATNMSLSNGLIRAEDILYCLKGSSTCTLPYALVIAPKCNGTGFQYPASASDAQCFNSSGTNEATSADVPEGARGCVNMTDAQINAESWPAYEKIVWRTADCQHYGVVIRDTGWSGDSGYAWQYQGAQAYSAFGQTDAWRTLAAQVGVSSSNGTDFTFKLSDLSNPPLVWCRNSKNDGLCSS